MQRIDFFPSLHDFKALGLLVYDYTNNKFYFFLAYTIHRNG